MVFSAQNRLTVRYLSLYPILARLLPHSLDQRRPDSSVKKEALGEHLAHSPKNLRNSRVCVPEPLYTRRPAREFRAIPRQAIFDRSGTLPILISELDRSGARKLYLPAMASPSALQGNLHCFHSAKGDGLTGTPLDSVPRNALVLTEVAEFGRSANRK